MFAVPLKHQDMKFLHFFLSSALLLSVTIQTPAQNGRSYSESVDIVTIDNVSASIKNLFIMDSLKSPHLASFEIELNATSDSKKIVASLLSAVQSNQALKLSLGRLNPQSQVMEQMDYKFPVVSEIIFSDLNAASKEPMRLTVKIRAQDVSVSSENKQTPLPVSARSVLCSNFKLGMGSLPTQRVSSITNLRISNPMPGYMNFTIEVARVDARPWKDWFNTGAGGLRREKSVISLLDAGMSELFSIQVPDVEIVSISESDNSQGIAKTVIGLRARRLDSSK
jgi:hypothetical protein